ncbi:NAD(P)/FAD-dependent oxidoreductase [Peloplasma aerotolerans]|uniref:FAD-dependent oxidoreductase n=1 Tax=Peloplasma aerotolerans TaxID=3044389 RepID=A0AAW6U9C3_9MOLU|nr:FAD-dependent oxidoreductase [Mariniplasma sp. M4Ah]MDI6453057.1 FAD-dependent oxidoreductase [Mariniplasma sp. M4Ah]
MILQESHKIKTLVLVGGGHAHIHILNKYNKKRYQNIKIILISSDTYQYYSGMASGYLEGIYQQDDFRFNLKAICNERGIVFIEDSVVKIDYENQVLHTKGNQKIEYDFLSLNTGSIVKVKKKELGPNVFSVKPLSNLKKIKNAIESLVKLDKSIVIMGGGAAGIEIALALSMYQQNDSNIHLTLIDRHNTLLNGSPKRVQEIVTSRMKEVGIETYLGGFVTDINENYVYLENGQKIAFDVLVLASGVAQTSLYKDSNFIVDDSSSMLVNDNLQSLSADNVFGAGDCIQIRNNNLVKKNGVYAIRQAPILWKNILKVIKGKSLKRFKAQKTYLQIISLGQKKGILIYGKLVISGYFAWKIKDLIDTSYMKKNKK